jgi:hypothetical protein
MNLFAIGSSASIHRFGFELALADGWSGSCPAVGFWFMVALDAVLFWDRGMGGYGVHLSSDMCLSFALLSCLACSASGLLGTQLATLFR